MIHPHTASSIALALAVASAPAVLAAQETEAHGELGEERPGHVRNAAKPHHLSVFVGGTHIDEEDETAVTIGVDYEYRVSDLLGLGFVVEQALGEIDSTTVLAVADIHLIHGLAVQVGPGIEFVDDTEFAIARLGMLYEVELGDHFTISPQFHYDLSEAEDAIVFGVAVGRAF